MAYSVGEVVDYKIKPGRGRPSLGTIIEKNGEKTTVLDSKGRRITIPSSAILGKHVSRYSERQRRLL